MNKKQSGMVSSYAKAIARELSDVYNNYSYAKAHAYNYCYNLMLTREGYDFRICGNNCFHFTCGFRFVNGDGKECLMYCTYANDYIIPLEG